MVQAREMATARCTCVGTVEPEQSGLRTVQAVAVWGEYGADGQANSALGK
jgi:hypothetical protein